MFGRHAKRIEELETALTNEVARHNLTQNERDDLRRHLSRIRGAFEPLERAVYPPSIHQKSRGQ